MHITKLELAGFGHFPEQTTIEFKPAALGLVLGKNETGKSTIIAAVFAALYGLKPTEKKKWRSWEGNGDYRIKLEFEHDKKKFLLERDLNKNFVRLVSQGDSEQILFNDYHLPSEKFDKIYFEAFKQISTLTTKDNMMATAVVYEHQLQVDVDANLRQLITGTRETDYEDVMAALEDEYYRITRERLPWQKYGGPRSDQLLEKKSHELRQLEMNIEDANRYFTEHREIQQNLLKAESHRQEVETKIPSLQRLLSVLQELKNINEEINLYQTQKQAVLKQLHHVESIIQKRDTLEADIEKEFTHLLEFEPTELEKEVSAFLPLKSRQIQMQSRLEDLESEIQLHENELQKLPDFNVAPDNFLYVIDDIQKIENKTPSLKSKIQELIETVTKLKRRFRSRWLFTSFIILITAGAGVFSYLFYPLSIIGWAVTALLFFTCIILFAVEVYPTRKELKSNHKELNQQEFVLNQLETDRKANFDQIKTFIQNNDLEEAKRDYKRYQEIRHIQEKIQILQNSLKSDLEAMTEESAFQYYSKHYGALIEKSGDKLPEEISRYRKSKEQLEAYQQQLNALPELANLKHEREELIQKISNLELRQEQLIKKVPSLHKLINKNNIESLIRKTEKQVQKLFLQKNGLESQITSYQVKLQQQPTLDYNPEQLMEERNILKEEISHLKYRRDALILALDTLRVSVNEFRNTYFDSINKGMQGYLEKVLSPMHLKVELDEDFKLRVSYKGIPIKLDQLSSGTHDQLFFAYRLVLGKLLSPMVHFPFMIDDAFVHFDPDRTARIFEILNEIKKDYQIIVCSSNPQYAQMVDYIINLDEIQNDS